MGQLGQPSGATFWEVFEVPDPLAPVWHHAQIWLKTMIVGALRLGLGLLSFRVLCLFKGVGGPAGQKLWEHDFEIRAQYSIDFSLAIDR